MSRSVVEPYSLYQTFNCNLPKTVLPKDYAKKMIDNIPSLPEHQKIAFTRLIIEHARLNNDLPSDLKVLPYNGKKSDDGSPEFTVTHLPTNLRWILWRFHEMCGESV